MAMSLAAFDEFCREIPPDSGRSSLPRTARARCTSRACSTRSRDGSGAGSSPLMSPAGRSASTADLPAMGLPPCTAAGPGRLHPVMAELRRARQPEPDHRGAGRQRTGRPGRKRERADMLCVNPITGTRDGRRAPAHESRTLVPTADLSDAQRSFPARWSTLREMAC